MVWTTPATFTAGNVLTAAQLNAVQDNLRAVGSAWTTYTPAWTTSGTAPTLGNGTLAGAYVAAGKLVMVRAVLTFGSTTNPGTGGWSLSLPATAAAGLGRYPVDGLARDDSATEDWLATGVIVGGASTIALRSLNTGTVGKLTNVTPTAPFTWATADSLTVAAVYEGA